MLQFFLNSEDDGPEWHYDGLPTPTSKEEYGKFSEEVLNLVTGSVSPPEGWTTLSRTKGVHIQEKVVNGSDVTSVKLSATLQNVSIEEVIKCIHSPTFDERKQLYDKLIHHEVVKEITPNVVITRSRFSTPFGVTDREFLTMRSLRRFEDGSCVIAVRSINDIDVPFDDNFVRGIGQSDIYVFPVENTESDVRVIDVSNVNPMGWIPTFVINSYKAEAANWLIRMQEVYGNE